MLRTSKREPKVMAYKGSTVNVWRAIEGSPYIEGELSFEKDKG